MNGFRSEHRNWSTENNFLHSAKTCKFFFANKTNLIKHNCSIVLLLTPTKGITKKLTHSLISFKFYI